LRPYLKPSFQTGLPFCCLCPEASSFLCNISYILPDYTVKRTGSISKDVSSPYKEFFDLSLFSDGFFLSVEILMEKEI
jgi:hypothetical protein